jgi:hypothetical protein
MCKTHVTLLTMFIVGAAAVQFTAGAPQAKIESNATQESRRVPRDGDEVGRREGTVVGTQRGNAARASAASGASPKLARVEGTASGTVQGRIQGAPEGRVTGSKAATVQGHDTGHSLIDNTRKP